jgi:YVTN family beta-propeller protein
MGVGFHGMALIALAVLACKTIGPALAQPLDGTLIVANRLGGSISFFDLQSESEVARLPIGPRIPHEVSASPDGAKALTGEYGTASNPGRHLVVMDVAEARIVGRIDLGPDSRPHSTAFLPDSRRAVATMEDSDSLALVDTTTLEVLAVYPTGGREGHMVRLSPDGRRAYVTSRGAEGTLSVIDLDADRPPTVIATGSGAEGLAVSPDGGVVWVVNRVAGSISIVDTRTLAVVDTLDVPVGAGRAEISASGRVLVPNGTSARALQKFLTLYDLGTQRVITQIAMSQGASAPGAYAIHIVGDSAFVADRALNSISIYDLADFPSSRVLTTDHSAPDGMAYSPVRVAAMRR